MRSEYEDGGGSIVYLSACLSGSAGGYAWRPPSTPVVTAAAVRAEAQRLVQPAALGLAPTTTTLVNIQTIMWVATPATRTLPPVRMLGHRVLIRLRLDHVAYTFGDGRSDTDGPAGTAYDDSSAPCRTRLCPGYYGHVYAHTGRLVVTAQAHWTATFTVDGGPSRPVPGDVTGPPARAPLHVREARAVLVPDP